MSNNFLLMFIRPKDYIVIENKLFFAVVSEFQEDERALCYLRYIKDRQGIHKLSTEEANEYIKTSNPEFQFYSVYADIELHGIPLRTINKIFQPEKTVEKLLHTDTPDDKQRDAIKLIALLLNGGAQQEQLGITGSLMLGVQNDSSDIDLLVYGRESFFKVRELLKIYLASGQLTTLDKSAWLEAYQRRGCSLSFDDYHKHEIRKINKCICGETKVDISMIPDESERFLEHGPYKKQGQATISAVVIDDAYAFDFPSRYIIEHDTIQEVVSYTATYLGQARQGEEIEVGGVIEKGTDGNKRLLVGTSREATGEYIRVVSKI